MNDSVLAVPYPELSPVEILDHLVDAQILLSSAYQEAFLYSDWPDMVELGKRLKNAAESLEGIATDSVRAAVAEQEKDEYDAEQRHEASRL